MVPRWARREGLPAGLRGEGSGRILWTAGRVARTARNREPFNREGHAMRWTTPEFEVVEVTMEVTAYVARG
jgi:coenzyme PQQ precursor peptide PqqA